MGLIWRPQSISMVSRGATSREPITLGKPGTVLLREYQGERHTVTVVPNGYVWHETTYASLSIIARAITGTSWNGPRLFGLRSGAEPTASSEAANGSPAPNNKRRLIRAVKSHPAGAALSPLVGDGERRP